MGIFDKLKRKSSSLTIEKIIATDYSQKYFDECKYIWKIMFPKVDRQIIYRESC